MPKLSANGIELAYEVHGEADQPVLLMIHGLGMPLSAWPPQFIEMLVAQGFRAVVFDNRDIGRSQLFDDRPMPNPVLQILKNKIGLRVRACYKLQDMARDAECLLDELGIENAHVVGVSMGGMIAQIIAIESPQRALSLTSMMSTTGNRRLPGATKPVERHILKGPAESTPAGRMAYQLKLWQLIGSPDFPTAEERRREWLQGLFDRGITADGVTRQLLAILASPDRTTQLQQLRVPTLVIHGDPDTLVPLECGRATAQAVPGSELVVIPGMGHDLPECLQPRVIDMIAKHARAAVLLQ